MRHFTARKIACASFKLCDQIARASNMQKYNEKAQKKRPDTRRGKVCVDCDRKLFFSSSYRRFLLGEVVDFFDKGAKHAESLCEAILVEIFRYRFRDLIT